MCEAEQPATYDDDHREASADNYHHGSADHYDDDCAAHDHDDDRSGDRWNLHGGEQHLHFQ